jgi:hypothetical protein
MTPPSAIRLDDRASQSSGIGRTSNAKLLRRLEFLASISHDGTSPQQLRQTDLSRDNNGIGHGITAFTCAA